MKEFPENINPDLLIAYINNEVSKEESLLVENWIKTSEDNKKHFEDFKLIWNESEAVFPTNVNVNTDLAWQKLSLKIEQTSLNHQTKSNKFSRFSILKIAAVVLPLVILGYIIFLQFNKIKKIEIVATDNIIKHNLPDGSLVQINKNSKIQFLESFNKNTRELKLDGEAFFNVVPNKLMPFIIHTRGLDVEVVGTSFNVKSFLSDSITEVYVKSGCVLLFAKKENGSIIDSVMLQPNEIGSFNRFSNKLNKRNNISESQLFWLNKTLVFNSTKLSEVFAIIENKYQAKIIIKDTAISNLKLTSRFNSQPMEEVMKIIEESFNLNIIKTNSTYYIDGFKK